MNAPLAVQAATPLPPALLMDENELMEVLESSLYRGAKRASIKMVVGYCKAQRLDPMQKPVHIVPVNTKVPGRNGDRDRWEWVDTVWPGINLYRTNASRSGRHAGTSEPEYGPTITREFVIPPKTDDHGNARGEAKRVTVSFPEWCRVRVKRVLDGGIVAEFVGFEYWLENYATVGSYSDAPNAMWTKRPNGQLAKCTEAQALRRAFPESCSGPTAEEMEGKTLDEDGRPVRPKDPHAVADDVLAGWLKKAREAASDADCSTVYQQGLQVLGMDVSAAAEFKRAVIERRRSLQRNSGATDASPKGEHVTDQEHPDPNRGEERQESAGEEQPMSGAPVVTLAKVLENMLSALRSKNDVALDVAADWISELPEHLRAEATAKYNEYKAELAGGKL
jgi:phage recombination protein Bet